jgi:protoporphyrinogen oxidase
LLCGACDPVNEIRRDFTAAEPIGDACVATAIDSVIAAGPQREMNVVATPAEGAEEFLVSTQETNIDCVVLADNKHLQLAYVSMGSVPDTEIQATEELMSEIEAAIRRNCVAAENMELVSERCVRMNCQARSP